MYTVPGLVLALLVAGVSSTAAQGCPSSKCNAYFANAMGGPVDCCKHDYASNPKCVWGGSPVSWKQTRTCSDSGKTYPVLVQSNFQGPPQNAECRCEVAMPPKPSVGPIQMTVQLKPKVDQDIKGSDFGCDGQSFCKVCGGLDAVKNACGAKPKCAAFTYDASSSCGYLKTGSGLVARSGWVAYIRE